MRLFKLCILFFISSVGIAQNPQLAHQYYSQGDYAKAAEEYKLLLQKFPYNKSYLYRLVDIYQKNGNYAKVDSLLNDKNELKHPASQIWLAYNFLLQKDSIKANELFDKAIKGSLKSSYLVSKSGKVLQDLFQLDKALELYSKGLEKFPNSSFELEEGRIYAQKNQPDKMMEAYLSFLDKKPNNLSHVRYILTPYLNDESGNETIEIIKKTIISHLGKNPAPAYFRLLEWFYIQEKNYKKAFYQLRSLYAKKEAEIGEVFYLGKKALEYHQDEVAQKIFYYVIEHSKDKILIEKSKMALLEIQMKSKNEADKQNLSDTFSKYLNEKWSATNRILLEILYSDFLAFNLGKSNEAIQVLSDLQKQALPRTIEARIKLKKGDIFLQQGHFNNALILYTQVQLDFPNNEIGHLATYKIAQASFFKGDIDWAHNQLKVIKSVHSDLISNDAIDLDMLIINNKEEGDTLQTALKELVKIKYLIFKKKNKEALKKLDSMKFNHKGQEIYDDVLWTQAKLYEEKGDYDKAIQNYMEIIDIPGEIVYKDDALFKMAKIYENKKENLMKAKELYKRITLDFPGSYWFTDARKAFRRLRGDEL